MLFRVFFLELIVWWRPSQLPFPFFQQSSLLDKAPSGQSGLYEVTQAMLVLELTSLSIKWSREIRLC